MKKLFSIIILSSIVLLVFLTLTKKETKNKQTLTIGFIAPLSGDFAPYGELALSGVRASLKGNQNITLITEDDTCEPTKAISAFRKLTSINKVDVIIGPLCGAPQEAIAPLVKEAHILTLLPSAAPKDIYEKSGGYMAQTQYTVEQESEFMAQTFINKGYKKVALISYENAFSEAHRKAFLAYMSSHSPSTIILDQRIIIDTADITPSILKIKTFAPDAIFANDVSFFFAGGTDKLTRYKVDAPLYTQYAAAIPSVQPLVKGAYYSYPENISPKEGPVFELSKLSADILEQSFSVCGADKECLQKEVLKRGDFINGVRKQTIVLHQIPK